MPGFARRPLAVLVCCLFAGVQASHAALDPLRLGLPLPDSEGRTRAPAAALPDFSLGDPTPVRLKLEKKFNLLAKKTPVQATVYRPVPVPGLDLDESTQAKGKDAYPAFISAERIEGRNDEVTEAEGEAELRKVGTLLLADKLTYWPLEDEVEAIGNVRYQQAEDEITGPHLRMKLSDQIGFFEKAEYKFRKEVANKFYRPVLAVTTAVSTSTQTGGAPLMINVPTGYGLPTSTPPRRPSDGYGQAERIDFEGENQIRLTNATYSTCKPGETDWYARADEMRLDYDRERGEVTNAAVYFKDVPIFYTPVGSFSLNHQRKSGFLSGTFAASTKNGLDLSVPYYWNIAPNYDATLYPRYMSKRGFQLGVDGQYVDYNYRGSAKLEYLPNDDIENRSRHAYNLMHNQNLGQGVTLTVNWNGVSDNRYWQDFSSRLLQTSQQQLPKQLVLGYSPGSWWSSSLQVLRYQTLNPDPEHPVARPYFIEPQLAFSGRLPNWRNADFSVYGQFSKFVHPDLVEGSRLVAYPQLALPYIDPAFIVVPKFGLHATQYSLDRQAAGTPSSLTRVVPTFTLDSSMVFEREAAWFGRNHIQTLEPRLYYVYIPYRDQRRIPVFDSGLGDFNFAQIFTENRYTGFDRVNDANQLTAGVTTRFLDANTGAERFKAMIGQRYYFEPQRTTIPGETARQKSFSNLLAAFNGLVLPSTYVDAAWEYDYHRSQSQRLSLGGRYQPELAKVLSAGYRFSRDALTGQGAVDQIDIAGQWPLSKQWYAVGRYNYSLRDSKILEAIGGVEYNAGCWAARFVVQRLAAIAGSANTTFFFQLELNDFANVGSNPIGLLRRTIPGYGKTNELPTTSNLLTTD